MRRLVARVQGHVQGVYFRHHTTRQANRLGLVGWVRNEPDGAVSVVAEGPEDKLDRLLDFLRQGPPAARVKSVDATWQEATGEFVTFGVR
jgi:acylphosphatase